MLNALELFYIKLEFVQKMFSSPGIESSLAYPDGESPFTSIVLGTIRAELGALGDLSPFDKHRVLDSLRRLEVPGELQGLRISLDYLIECVENER